MLFYNKFGNGNETTTNKTNEPNKDDKTPDQTQITKPSETQTKPDQTQNTKPGDTQNNVKDNFENTFKITHRKTHIESKGNFMGQAVLCFII
jgi:hypothetical protein